jgi:hypothetical protein
MKMNLQKMESSKKRRTILRNLKNQLKSPLRRRHWRNQMNLRTKGYGAEVTNPAGAEASKETSRVVVLFAVNYGIIPYHIY